MQINFVKYKKHIVAVFAALALVLSALNYSLASTKDASKYVYEISNEVLTLIAREDINDAQKQEKLRVIFKKVVDTEWIGKFALGRYWKVATPAQQKEYLELFGNYLADIYVPNFKKYTSQKMKIVNVTETGANEYLVQTELSEPLSNYSVKINYRLIKKGGDYKDFAIFDIAAEGISLISTQRAEFSAIVARSGLNSLIDNLRSKKK